MKSYLIGIIFILLLLAAGSNVYYINKMNKAKKELMEAQSKVRVVSDSLQIVKTENGVIASGYAELGTISDSLRKSLFYKDKKIYEQQNTIAELKVLLNRDTVVVFVPSDSIVGTTFHNTYKDKGLDVMLSDSVRFNRIEKNVWSGYNIPTFSALISLQNTIGRNKDGTFYGSVQSFSPSVKIKDVKTIIDDKYISPAEERKPNEFALGGSLDNNTVAPGIRLRFGNWQLGAEYILISNNPLNGILERLRGSFYYFLF